MTTNRITHAEYRRLLNAQDQESRRTAPAFIEKKHKNGRYHQRTRLYGDYLWHQDRCMFLFCYAEYMARLNGEAKA